MKVQLHKVGLDGKGDRRLTDPKFTHQVDISPDGSSSSTSRRRAQAPTSSLVDVAGEGDAERRRATSGDGARGVPQGEVTYLAADGKTTLWRIGSRSFDPSRKYPT
jgi:dipeptidyl-peptidase-4